MDDKACDVLSEVDNLFTRGIVNVGKFNKFTKCHSYCPRQNKCTNDYERINALGSYLFNEILKIDKSYKEKYGVSQNIELFMIWLGDKLFKMDSNYKETLEESYKKHLENHMGNFNYWDVINSKSIYKDATIRKMSELYILLNNICKLITEYNKNTQKPDSKRLGNYSTQCINSYRSFYTSASGCKPYLRLLDSLKMMYEIFRATKIVNNNLQGKEKTLLLNRVNHLTMFKDQNQLFVTVNENLSFSDKECIGVKSKDEKIGEQILQNKPKSTGKSKTPIKEPQKKSSPSASQGKKTLPAPAKPPTAPSSQPSPQPKPQPKQQQPSQPVAPIQSPDPPQKPGTPLPPPVPPLTSSQKDTQLKTPQAGEIHQNRLEGPGDGKGSGQDSGKDSGTHGSGGAGVRSGDQSVKDSQKGIGGGKSGGQGIPSSGASDGQGSQGITSSESGSSNGGAGGGKGDAGSGGNGGSSVQDGQGGQTKGPGDPSRGNPIHPQSAPASSGTGTTSSPQSVQQPPQQADSPPPVPPQSQDQQKQRPEGQPPSQNDSSLPTPQTGGSNDSKEPKDSGDGKGNTGDTNNNKGDLNGGNGNPIGGSSDPASSTSEGSFNLLSPFLGFIFNGTNKLNQASQFIEKNRQNFENAKNKISDAYNNTVDNLKNAYNASSDYLNDFISNITSQLNQFDPTPKSDGNQTRSGSSTGGGNPSIPPIDPQPPSPPTPSPTPSPTSPQITPPAPPSNPIPNPIQDPSKSSLQQNQSPPQPRPITHQNPQLPSQANHLNSQKIGQLVKSISFNPILKKPWNIFPTTWNGSGDCKPEIKFMNATLVCCTFEQCSLTGIPVILILIPIILLIAYKYLSFGLSKKSEKKNMKRVINFHDGNRKTKIIISSYDKKKDLKPVINSVGGKKKSLLNIYKIIQADPMPFINLFFLLIFFVYKRKRDTIE
ncbi:PIR protein CIR protein [Plasmodium vinckei lentum]|uniref:PIR protein CIR protein n=1 Tax=Plasmodium vinckei lentum TaxID=138297 RepID=A0A6V7SA58_PLAVN|nr:PIR protein CIR protein [Plasmodium vinckei lentum]